MGISGRSVAFLVEICHDTLPMATPNSNLWRLVDDRFGGRLAERIQALDAEGLTWERIAFVLNSEGDTAVPSETFRQWGLALGIARRRQPEDAA